MSDETRELEVERSTSTAHRLSRYDGVCGNIHGHNMRWEVDVTVSMEEVGDDNMPLDLKDISDEIDEVDHACILSEKELDQDIVGEGGREVLEEFFGDIIWFDGDPTCEVLSKWMARKIYYSNDAITHVGVTVAETEKYALSAHYGEYDEMREVANNE